MLAFFVTEHLGELQGKRYRIAHFHTFVQFNFLYQHPNYRKKAVQEYAKHNSLERLAFYIRQEMKIKIAQMVIVSKQGMYEGLKFRTAAERFVEKIDSPPWFQSWQKLTEVKQFFRW